MIRPGERLNSDPARPIGTRVRTGLRAPAGGSDIDRSAVTTPAEPEVRPRRALSDVVVLTTLVLVAVAAASLFRPFASLLERARTMDGPQTDAILALAIMIPVAATIFARRRYRDALEIRTELVRLSLHDVLTGLPNRRLLHDWLAVAIDESRRSDARAALLFIDLDRFKQVNDTHGHEVGDRLMAAVAERLTDLVEPGARVLRYGGDEFVVIAPGIDPRDAAQLARSVISVVERPFSVGGETVRISASIGISIAEDRSADLSAIIRDADTAMFQAKSRGPGNVVVFDRTMDDAVTPANVEARIRSALDGGELHLHLQPVVELDSGTIIGAEALLRWIREDGDVMSPAEFVPVLEETGLIVPVGTWVLQEGCRLAARLAATHGRPITITLNVSARQIGQTDFADKVADAVARSGVDPGQIYLEITEGALLHDVGAAWTMLRQVKSLGVGLALDDFGTGYSSLSYVRRFSLDMLKIDKSFIDGLDSAPEDGAIVSHVIGMAHALGMMTVAEGVERAEQLVLLREMGCRAAQGYAMSRPIPVPDFEDLLRSNLERPFWTGDQRPADRPTHHRQNSQFEDPHRRPRLRPALRAETSARAPGPLLFSPGGSGPVDDGERSEPTSIGATRLHRYDPDTGS